MNTSEKIGSQTSKLWYNVSSPENGQEGGCMRKWNVYVYLNETIEADDQFEAEQKGLEMIGSDGIRAEEIFEEGEEEGARGQ